MGQTQWIVIFQLALLGGALLLVIWYCDLSRRKIDAQRTSALMKRSFELALELRHLARLKYITQQLIDNCDKDAMEPSDFLELTMYNYEAIRYCDRYVSELSGIPEMETIVPLILSDAERPIHSLYKKYHTMLPEVK